MRKIKIIKMSLFGFGTKTRRRNRNTSVHDVGLGLRFPCCGLGCLPNSFINFKEIDHKQMPRERPRKYDLERRLIKQYSRNWESVKKGTKPWQYKMSGQEENMFFEAFKIAIGNDIFEPTFDFFQKFSDVLTYPDRTVMAAEFWSWSSKLKKDRTLLEFRNFYASISHIFKIRWVISGMERYFDSSPLYYSSLVWDVMRVLNIIQLPECHVIHELTEHNVVYYRGLDFMPITDTIRYSKLKDIFRAVEQQKPMSCDEIYDIVSSSEFKILLRDLLAESYYRMNHKGQPRVVFFRTEQIELFGMSFIIRFMYTQSFQISQSGFQADEVLIYSMVEFMINGVKRIFMNSGTHWEENCEMTNYEWLTASYEYKGIKSMLSYRTASLQKLGIFSNERFELKHNREPNILPVCSSKPVHLSELCFRTFFKNKTKKEATLLYGKVQILIHSHLQKIKEGFNPHYIVTNLDELLINPVVNNRRFIDESDFIIRPNEMFDNYVIRLGKLSEYVNHIKDLMNIIEDEIEQDFVKPERTILLKDCFGIACHYSSVLDGLLKECHDPMLRSMNKSWSASYSIKERMNKIYDKVEAVVDEEFLKFKKDGIAKIEEVSYRNVVNKFSGLLRNRIDIHNSK